eukprot:100808_1
MANKQEAIECTSEKVTRCEYASLFIKAMASWIQDRNCIVPENVEIYLNCYLHLLHKHDSMEAFEYIMNTLGICNVGQCVSFRRDYSKMSTQISAESVYEQIMDKMHCYYYHCFDTGSRLSSKEQQILSDIISKYDDSLINKSILKLNQMIQKKRESLKNILGPFQQRINIKYNQLNAEEKYNANKFEFGFVFKYGDDDDGFFNDDVICIRPKYSNLKTEIISNEIAVLNIKQFNTEYKKARIHFYSQYCRHNFKPFKPKQSWGYTYSSQPNDISLECILSLMIYCNCTQLQYEFTKTYREKQGINHSQFYNLGKYLKLAVNEFGTSISDGTLKTFYHGISEILMFSSIIGQNGISIQCPLSTTSCIEVAINFTNDNNGIIIEFGGFRKFGSDSKYFPCFWLSDYGNEKEYLFLQMNSNKFYIQNITEPRSGIEYGVIIHALRVIKNIMVDHFVDPSWCQQEKMTLITKLLHDRLSDTFSEYNNFKSLNKYSQTMCDIYFNNQRYINVDFDKLKSSYLSILQLLCCKTCDMIYLPILNAIFPKLD